MANLDIKKSQEKIQKCLNQVINSLQRYKESVELLEKNQTSVAHDESQKRLSELENDLDGLHSADVAHILESLPLNERLIIWNLVKVENDGDILLEVCDAVRETLLADMDDNELLAAAKEMDADQLADLTPELPNDVVYELMQTLDAQQRDRVSSALSYEEGQIGSIMDFEMVTIRENITLEVVLRYLRRLKELPSHTDKLFVVNASGVLKGILPFKKLLLTDLDTRVCDVMVTALVTFQPDENSCDAAHAFERYDLISAPVIDDKQRLIGRLTVDEMVDFIREESESEVLNMAGLREEEDIFSSVWKSLQNRWAWLAINLMTAFLASRVIDLFHGSIEKLVALAALMPIVAGIGGNSGNQTITMIVRAMALKQIPAENTLRLLKKEVSVSLINGLVWGGVIGAIAWLLYGNAALGAVMVAATTLNLLLAGFMGVLIPTILVRLGKDPAIGSSVMITAVTDSGGFFIFLGLATIFLI